MDASINPILAIIVVVIPASVTVHEGFEHAVLDAISVVGLIRPPVGVLSYRVTEWLSSQRNFPANKNEKLLTALNKIIIYR